MKCVRKEISSQLRFGEGGGIHVSGYEGWQSPSSGEGNGSHSGNDGSSIQGSQSISGQSFPSLGDMNTLVIHKAHGSTLQFCNSFTVPLALLLLMVIH
jgi:hypothetical protein